MPEDTMLNEAIEAVRQRQIERARDLLTRLLRADKNNPAYWLWMSTVVHSVKEQVYCLQMVLRLDPNNQAAKRGLVLMGAAPPDPNMKPAPLVRRKWEVSLPEPPSKRGIKALWANPFIRIVVFSIFGLLAFGLVLLGVFGTFWRIIPVYVPPTNTPGPPPTYTPTPTYIGYIAPPPGTSIPTPGEPPPLWTLLEATYTPTPLYVNTPHPISEAFRAAQQAFGKGDWGTALQFFQQAAEVEPDSADIVYYIGEAQRMQGDTRSALAAFNLAIALNPAFSPAYLGRARLRLASNQDKDAEADLQKAIASDPNLAEAYLERVAYWAERGQIEKALQDLSAAENLLPNSPLPHLYRAQVALRSGDAKLALQAAEKAFELDRTLLPAYLALGEAALLNGDFDTTIETLTTYLQYKKKDAEGWLAIGRAYAGLGEPSQIYNLLVQTEKDRDYQRALDAFERAIKLDDQLPGIFLYRGLTYLALGEGQKAVNDLLVARQLEASQNKDLDKSQTWFAINLGLGRALMAADRLQDAYEQIHSTRNMAQTDEQMAALYYWRALVLEALGNKSAAVKDWQSLLSLPKPSVDKDWAATAQERIATLSASRPSSTPTNTRTPYPSLTPTVTRTPKPTPIATTLSWTPSSTRIVTPTPTP